MSVILIWKRGGAPSSLSQVLHELLRAFKRGFEGSFALKKFLTIM